MAALILVGAVSSPASGQVIDRTGDLRAEIFDRLVFPVRDSNRYCLPTPEGLDVWRQAVDATLSGDLAVAANLLQNFAPCSPFVPSYKVVRYTDASTQRLFHILLEADDDLNPTAVTGWGTYFFDPSPLRELSIQVPHPRADLSTERQGFDAFSQLSVRSLLLAGTHRCASTSESPCSGPTPTCNFVRASDPPHGATSDPRVTNAFQIVHQAISTFMPRTVYLQIHGNSSCSADLLLSNTDSEFTIAPGSNVERLQASLEAIVITPPPDPPLSHRACSSRPEPACNLCGTNNLQGRWTNGSTDNACRDPARALPDEPFIHIEQTLRMRQLDQDPLRDPPLHQVLIQAINSTMFVQEQP
jgi:hypothetical protein